MPQLILHSTCQSEVLCLLRFSICPAKKSQLSQTKYFNLAPTLLRGVLKTYPTASISIACRLDRVCEQGSSSCCNERATAVTKQNTDAPVVDIAQLKLRKKMVVVAQSRPATMEWICLEWRDGLRGYAKR